MSSEKLTLKTISSGYLSIDDLNNNFTAIEEAIDAALGRSDAQPNNMLNSIDMDHNTIINVKDPINPTDAANLRTISQYFLDNTIDPDRVPIGSIPHSHLAGLGTGDDHPQYFNEGRGDTRYYTKTIGDDRYAYSTHTHLLGDISNWDDAMSNFYLSLELGGTVKESVVFEDTITVGGVEHRQLIKVSDQTVFEDNDVLLYDGPSAAWYGIGVSEFIGDLTVQSIFDIGDVNRQDSMTGGAGLAKGQYLKYGSVDGNTPYTWYNAQIQYSELGGTPEAYTLPYAFRHTNFVGNVINGLPSVIDAKLVVNQSNTTQWDTISASTGALGSVLTVVTNPNTGQSFSLEPIPATVPAMADLTDVNLNLATATVDQCLKYDGDSWEYCNLLFSNVGGLILSTQLPTTIQGIAATDGGRTAGDLVLWDGTSTWTELAANATGTPLVDAEHILTLKANGQVNWTQWTEPTTSVQFKCSDLNGCSVSELTDVPILTSASNAGLVLAWDGTSSYTAQQANAHEHEAGTVFAHSSTNLPWHVIPFGEDIHDVARGDHTHQGVYQLFSWHLSDLAGTTFAQPGYTVAGNGTLGNVIFMGKTVHNHLNRYGYCALPNPSITNNYLAYNTTTKNPEWKQFPSTGGSATDYMYQLLDTAWVDNDALAAGNDEQMIYWNTSTDKWDYSTIGLLGDSRYALLTGGLFTGSTSILPTVEKVYGLKVGGGHYSGSGIIVESVAATKTGISIVGETTNEQMYIGGVSEHLIYMDINGSKSSALKIGDIGSSGKVAIGITGSYSNSGLYMNTDSGTNIGINLLGTKIKATINDTSTGGQYGINLLGNYSLYAIDVASAVNSSGKINAHEYYKDGVLWNPSGGSGVEQDLFKYIYIDGVRKEILDATSPTDSIRFKGSDNINITNLNELGQPTNEIIIKLDTAGLPSSGNAIDAVPTGGVGAASWNPAVAWTGMTGQLKINRGSNALPAGGIGSLHIVDWDVPASNTAQLIESASSGAQAKGLQVNHTQTGTGHGDSILVSFKNQSSFTEANTAVYAKAFAEASNTKTYALHGETRILETTTNGGTNQSTAMSGTFEALAEKNTGGSLIGIKTQAAKGGDTGIYLGYKHQNSRGMLVHGSNQNTGTGGRTADEMPAWTVAGLEFSKRSIDTDKPAIMLSHYANTGGGQDGTTRHRLYLTPPSGYAGNDNGTGGVYSADEARGIYVAANAAGNAIEFYIDETLALTINAGGVVP